MTSSRSGDAGDQRRNRGPGADHAVPVDRAAGGSPAHPGPEISGASTDPTGLLADMAGDAGGTAASESTEDTRTVGSAPDAVATAALARARGAAAARGIAPSHRRRPRPIAGTPRRSPAQDDRDPVVLGQQVDRLVGEQGWVVDVAAGKVMARWSAIAGADVAGHVTPTGFEDGVLTVRAESTAWATQLRYLRTTLLARIDEEIGPGTVTSLRVVGPSAPSWSRGRLRARGRGPRDTYG